MKKFFMFMMMAMTLVFIPSCENEEELSNQGEQPVSGLATATGEYVGTIERATSQGLSTVNDNAIIEVQAFDDNTIDITFPKVKSGLLSIEDLVFTEVPVEEVENSADVWNFEEDEEVIEYLLNLANYTFEDFRKANKTAHWSEFKLEMNKMSNSGALFDLVKLNDVCKNKIASYTAEQVYEKIAASNVAVIVYRNNSVYTEGTGIIMKEDDAKQYTYILTCAHVISDSGTEIVIQFEDGTRHDAETVGYDLRTDIGVLRIKATGFQAAEFGDSDSLKVGSTIYAIGNPGGSALFGTFTDGKVSAIGRNITSSIGYDMVCIQHNAAISPGNSGGALVNEYGQVIGINSSKIAATEFEGISFSIPITQAKDVINKIIVYGYVPGRAKLGISYVANDSSSINGIYAMAVQMMDLPSGSLVIYSIDAESALAGTKAQPGDMITAVNGKKLDTADVLLETIENSSVGDELELSLFRIESVGGRYSTEEFKVKVRLIEEKNTDHVEETTTRGVIGNGGEYDFGYGFGF